MCWYRIKALILRYTYLYSRNSFRILDIVFWPLMDLLVWGFVSMYLLTIRNGLPYAVLFLIGAIIFWDVLYRSQQAVAVSFLEDVWSRNLLNIFVAPVAVSEFILATYLVGLVQCAIVICLMAGLAYLFYSFNLLTMGLNLIPLFGNLLVMGWSTGLITTALIIRFGQQAEALAWAIPFLIQPLSAVFYPVDILPPWLKPIALLIPATHVFEGMRQILAGSTHTEPYFLKAALLNAAYMIAAGIFFNHMFNEARKRGLLAKLGT